MYVEYDDEADGAYIWFVNDIEEVITIIQEKSGLKN